MRASQALGLVVVALMAGSAFAFQRFYRDLSPYNRWSKYEPEMQDPVDDPPDGKVPAEFAFARLRYRSPRDGYRYSRWGVDANKSDRLFMQAIRRLSRVQTKSIEEIVDVDDDAVYDWPFLYAVGAGDWVLSPAQAQRLKNFFDRGGFLMVDDIHNEIEWGDFMAGIQMMYPDAQAIELADDEPIFHTVYDLTHRFQISGYNIVRGQPYERGGIVPHWRAILDGQGRVIVAGCHNMDLGDAWEFADAPEYPEKLSSMAFRVGVNYLVYDMTH